MILVWMKKIDEQIKGRDPKDVLKLLCPGHREELRTRTGGDGWKESAAAELLLQEMLMEYEIPKNPQNWNWRRGEYGKPYIPEIDPWEFNWSHTDEWVVCAVADAPVGVDIQAITKIRPSVLKRIYTESEREAVANAMDPDRRFTEIWTWKEANAKWSGRGLTRRVEQTAPFAVTTAVDDQIITVCSEEDWDGHVRVFVESEYPL